MRLALVLLLIAPTSVFADPPASNTSTAAKEPLAIPAALQEDVNVAESVGSLIYWHDRAAEKATDSLLEAQAFQDPPGEPMGWVTSDLDGGVIRISFIAKIAGAPKVFAEADFDPNQDKVSNAHALAMYRPLSDMELAQNQAVQTVSKEEWLRCAAKYNQVVLPIRNGEKPALRVFLIPARQKSDDFPMGGFHSFTVSGDGKSVIDRFSQTKTCLNGAAPQKLVALMSSQINSPAPTAFHVFMNLNYRLPVYTVTVQNNILWQIANGKVSVASLDMKKKK